MKIGDIVIFNGKKVIIQWVYESGYCEVRHVEKTIIELVQLTELQVNY